MFMSGDPDAAAYANDQARKDALENRRVPIRIFPKVGVSYQLLAARLEQCETRYQDPDSPQDGPTIVFDKDYAGSNGSTYLRAEIDRQYSVSVLGRDFAAIPLTGHVRLIRDDDSSEPVNFIMPKELGDVVDRIVLEFPRVRI